MVVGNMSMSLGMDMRVSLSITMSTNMDTIIPDQGQCQDTDAGKAQDELAGFFDT